MVSYTCTQWVLNPRPHPPTDHYGRKCQLAYSSLAIVILKTMKEKVEDHLS